MAEALKFDIKLKEREVLLDDGSGEKRYVLKELTGDQRAEYNDSFDITVKTVDGKPQAVAGENFKLLSGKDFLALCLYDEEDKLVPPETIGKFPATVVDSLHKEALELSGMDKEALDNAKNESAGNDTNGSESLPASEEQ